MGNKHTDAEFGFDGYMALGCKWYASHLLIVTIDI